MPDKLTITRDQLANALEIWEGTALANNWPARIDADRFQDSADFLFSRLIELVAE